MESATLTRPVGAKPSARHRFAALPWPALCLAALCLASLVGFFAYPTYPNYDSYYSLLWGQEVLRGELPSYDAFRAPTPHPLAIAFGGVLSVLGQEADRVMVLATVLSFIVLVVAVYRLARVAFTPLVGLAAALILLTRFDFPFLAARAYLDVPFLALVMWAAVLELEQRRRGTPVLVLLLLAGLLRPEAWVLAGLYWLWLLPRAAWPARVRQAVLVAAAPLLWVLTDFIATGDPLWSQTHTSELAGSLGRNRGITELPAAFWQFLINLDKLPVLLLGIAGAGAAVWLVPRRTGLPLALFGGGALTFVAIGLAGLSVIDRYLLVPSLVVMVFAAFGLAGWSVLEPGHRARRPWQVLAVLAVAYGAFFTATRVNFSVFDNELRLRGASHESLERLIAQPAFQRGLECGVVSVPNHKLVPDVRWLLGGATVTEVVPRADDAPDPSQGVAMVVSERAALLRQALVEDGDDPADALPPAGFAWAAAASHHAAYTRC
jgi:hypothetical protein